MRRFLSIPVQSAITALAFAALLPMASARAERLAPPALRLSTPGEACRHAIAAAERAASIPPQLLAAIARVESGRFDPTSNRTIPWPWTINAEGRPGVFQTKEQAIAAVRNLQAQGVRSIDVGCMQVNLMHHPNAFATLDDAFDPYTNARYAARLLVSAKQRLGTWTAAVEAYHSANPARAIPYGRAVMGRWTEAAGAAVPSQPVSAHGMKVWTPSPTGSAPSMIAIPPAAPGGRTVVVLPAPHR